MITVEVIPYRTFKQRIRLIKELKRDKRTQIEIYPTYIYIERGEQRMIGVQSYKDLLELIDINENILNNCKQSHRQIEMFLLKQGRPAGYREATSYLDADCIHGSRKELHADELQKLIDEMGKLESMIYLQEEMLKGFYKTKREIDEKLKSLEGIEYKVYYMHEIEGRGLKEIACTLGYSEDHIRRVSSRLGKCHIEATCNY